MKRRKYIRWIFCLPLLAAFFVLSSCATNPVTGKQELMLLSESDEVRLGQQTDKQVVNTYALYDDADLSAYINQMGQRLGKLSHRPDLSYTFKVLDTPVVNAFAVPGGYVYMTRGILSYLSDEAELAGVLGHEIGHISARHSAHQYSRAQLAQLGLGLGSIISSDFREFAQVAAFGVSMLFLKFSRDNERQADDLGVEYSTKAGYDATHMANFFETLQRKNPESGQSGLPEWFSTHPNPPDRIKAVQAKSKEWAAELGVTDLKVNRDLYLRKIDGMVFGEDPRQGYVDDNIFYHPDLRFQFPVPANWKLNNTSSQVQIVSPNKDAAIVFAIGSGASPRDAAQKFAYDAQANVLVSNSLTVNGLSAYQLICDIATQSGILRVMSYFVKKDKYIYVFHGFTSQGRFSTYRATFQNTMDGFRQLTSPEKINVQPDRIQIRSTNSDGTLENALRSFGVSDKELENMAVLNGKQLTDTIPSNTLLKVVKKGR
jgi:predicted Zn-dependent protease